MKKIFAALSAGQSAGRGAVLCSIAASSGSTPRGPGAAMLALESGEAIGTIGGPRCCKRNAFTAIRAAVEFTAERRGVSMELPERIVCRHFQGNQQCLRHRCPYYPAGR